MVDYFLKIDTVAGDSHDAQHHDEIEVLAFSSGETPQKANGSLGTAVRAGWDVKLNKEV